VRRAHSGVRHRQLPALIHYGITILCYFDSVRFHVSTIPSLPGVTDSGFSAAARDFSILFAHGLHGCEEGP